MAEWRMLKRSRGLLNFAGLSGQFLHHLNPISCRGMSGEEPAAVAFRLLEPRERVAPSKLCHPTQCA
jgi:hypothetical protein